MSESPRNCGLFLFLLAIATTAKVREPQSDRHEKGQHHPIICGRMIVGGQIVSAGLYAEEFAG